MESCGIKSMRPIFKTKMLIHQSKANLDLKNCLMISLILRTQKAFGTKAPNFILVHDLLAIEIKIHF